MKKIIIFLILLMSIIIYGKTIVHLEATWTAFMPKDVTVTLDDSDLTYMAVNVANDNGSINSMWVNRGPDGFLAWSHTKNITGKSALATYNKCSVYDSSRTENTTMNINVDKDDTDEIDYRNDSTPSQPYTETRISESND